ncbi:transposase family protein [Mycobacterium lacus]|uniref:transposase family protein n=1 Tax=Mycobacterium lacus TaxID=169765 RepID=UPI001E3904D7|nr:transposase family protein [Mycobacterium lacus]
MQVAKPTIRTRGHTHVPSSPTPPADANPTRHERLLQALQTVPDPRDRRGVRYSLAGVLALAVTATLAGCRSFAAIGQWAAEAASGTLASFGVTSGSARTNRRCANCSPASMPTPSTKHWACGCGREPSPSSSVA